jgi:peptide-methionine (S)-S-oxide reductase
MSTTHRQNIEVAVFGGGCFWCTEAVFKMLRGVLSVMSGYAGGTAGAPTYEQVSSGTTGHAEVVRIEFDPMQISFHDLLTVFFASHDPTTPNRQGADVGTQYRSIVLYSTQEQRAETQSFIAELNASSTLGAPIVTELRPFDDRAFYPAEEYHRDYYDTHPDNQYCELVINPKLEKVQKQFAQLLKTQRA